MLTVDSFISQVEYALCPIWSSFVGLKKKKSMLKNEIESLLGDSKNQHSLNDLTWQMP